MSDADYNATFYPGTKIKSCTVGSANHNEVDTQHWDGIARDSGEK